MKRDLRTPVRFGFIVKSYYRIKAETGLDTHEVKGVKSLKLFKSWWRLMKSRNRLLYGYIKFADGETWIWQPESDIRHDKYWHGGWQKALTGRHEQRK